MKYNGNKEHLFHEWMNQTLFNKDNIVMQVKLVLHEHWTKQPWLCFIRQEIKISYNFINWMKQVFKNAVAKENFY